MTAMRKLQRKKAPRELMMRNLTASILLYERVKTTEARAKEARRFVDKMINLGKSGTLADRRRLLAWLPDRQAAKKVFEVLVARYSDRPSGYSRLIRLGTRVGDGASSFLIELLPDKNAPTKSKAVDSHAAAEGEVIETKPTRRGVARLSKPKAEVTIRRSGAKPATDKTESDKETK